MAIKKYLFIIALFIAMLIGYVYPKGIEQLPLDIITDIGIGFIFLLYGLKISVSDFKKGLSQYPVHILVQTVTFVLFPLLVLVFFPIFNDTPAEQWWLSFFYLAALPSSVSSSVIMVSLARGNVSAAIFNASISGLLGILITPFWLQFFLDSSEGFHIGNIVWHLLLQIVFPLVLGLLIQKFKTEQWNKVLSKTGIFDKTIICLIVYSSFSRAFKMELFSSLGILGFVAMITAVAALFGSVYGLTAFISKRLSFSKENQITAIFCGSKKSLIHGSAMGKVMFNSSQLSIFLLPIMLYHAFQLVVIALIVDSFAKRKE